MKRLFSILFLLAAIAICPSCRAQTLDAYGGRTDITCPAGVKPRFYVQKVGNRWWLCTPLGNAFFFEGIGALTPGPDMPNPGNRYGSTNQANITQLQLITTGWGFNAIGEKTFGNVEHKNASLCPGCLALPEIQTQEYLGRALTLDSACGTGLGLNPVKNLTWAMNGFGAPWFFKASVDMFDQVNLIGYFHACFTNDTGFIAYKNDPYFVGVLIDDSDFIISVGAGPDFDAAAHNDSDIGRVTLSASPTQVINPQPTQGNLADPFQLYVDTKVYSKTAMTSPPAVCALATPCSLRDYLAKKYTTIGALNTAWSNPVQQQQWNASQSVNEGNGGSSKGVNANLTTLSWSLSPTDIWADIGIAILPSGGSAPTADNSGQTINTCNSVSTCTLPNFAVGGGANRLLFVGIGYRAGGGTSISGVTFGGVALTSTGTKVTEGHDGRTVEVWYLIGPSTSTANIIVSWTNNNTGGIVVGADSWNGVNQTTPFGTRATATGFGGAQPKLSISTPVNSIAHDSLTWTNGTSTIATVAPANNPVYTTFDSSGINRSQNICTGTTWTGSNSTCSDTLSNLIASPNSVQITVDGTLQAGDCPWTAGVSNAGGLNSHWCGGPLQHAGRCGQPDATNFGCFLGKTTGTIANTTTINYVTGAMVINFTVAPSAGVHTITVTYVQNGWPLSLTSATGLMDEDGSSPWMGTNVVCLLPVNGGGPGTDSWGCGNPTCGRTPANLGGWNCPDMQPVVAADLETWVGQFSAQFHAPIKAQLRADAPNMLFMGEDILGAWLAPINKNWLLGAAGNLDINFTNYGWNPEGGSGVSFLAQSDAAIALNYMTQYYGDNPLMNFETWSANDDSSFAGTPGTPTSNSTTQGKRAQLWHDITNAMLTTLSFNNTYQWVGDVWWGYEFCNSENRDWGLVTCNDNPYNAHDAVCPGITMLSPQQAFTSTCEPPPGGSAVRPFGDGITNVKSGNLLWLSIISSSLGVTGSGTITGSGVIKNP